MKVVFFIDYKLPSPFKPYSQELCPPIYTEAIFYDQKTELSRFKAPISEMFCMTSVSCHAQQQLRL